MNDEMMENSIKYMKTLKKKEDILSLAETKIRELCRVISVLREQQRHPWRYLFWNIKERLKWYKLKLKMILFPHRKYKG